MKHILYTFFILSLLMVVPLTVVFGAPKSELWSFWASSEETSTTVIDHTRWTELLKKYLIKDHPSGINRFQYSKVSENDKTALQRYVDALENVKVRDLNRREQMAYWINLYNALTVKVIIEHYPIKSIRDIDLASSRGPWDAKLVTIEGKDVSLNDIEHRILRPVYKDNRVHYAVNCASIGCPNLLPNAFTSQNLDQQLDEGAREYVNHPRGVAIDGKRMTLSSIYRWFQEDFKSSEEGVIEHLVTHASPELVEKLKAFKGKIKYEYDWSLNE